MPSLQHQIQCQHQVRRVHYHDPFLKCLLRQPSIVVHGQHITALVRDKHQHIRDRVFHILRVFIVCQFLHVLFHRVAVAFLGLFACRIVCRPHIVLVGSERHLRVNNDACSVGAVHHHIGAQFAASLVLKTFLWLKLYAFSQTAVPQYIVQHLLAPVAMHFSLVFERLSQVVRFLSHLLRLLHHSLKCALERRGILVIPLFGFLEQRRHLLHILPKRSHQFFDMVGIGFLQFFGTLFHDSLRGLCELRSDQFQLLPILFLSAFLFLHLFGIHSCTLLFQLFRLKRACQLCFFQFSGLARQLPGEYLLRLLQFFFFRLPLRLLRLSGLAQVSDQQPQSKTCCRNTDYNA